jgi:SPP1 family predicted phage head-tail adaptor
MNIGTLDERLLLEEPVRTPDGGGGAAVTWQPLTELWGHVRPISGEERLVHDQLAGRLTHEVWIRWRAGVTAAMRFRQDTRIYEIVAVLEARRRIYLKCLCEERSP